MGAAPIYERFVCLIGYEQKAVPYRGESRYAGKTKWNYWALWNFALEGITLFTEAPLKIATYLGLLTAFGAFMYGVFVIIKTLLFGDPVAPSLDGGDPLSGRGPARGDWDYRRRFRPDVR